MGVGGGCGDTGLWWRVVTLVTGSRGNCHNTNNNTNTHTHRVSAGTWDMGQDTITVVSEDKGMNAGQR